MLAFLLLALWLPAEEDVRASLVKAQQAFERGDWLSARAELKKVLQFDPGNLGARYNLGLVALRQHNAEEALAQFQIAHRAAPSDPGVLAGLLETQLLTKRFAEARQSARKLETLIGPEDPQFFHAASVLAANGEYAAGIRMLEKVRARFPDSYDVSYNLALANFRAGRLAEAQQILSSMQSGKPEIDDLLGSIYHRQRNGPAALAAFRRASQAEPSNEDYAFNFCSAQLEFGAAAEAGECFRSALARLPASWRVRLGLGAALYISAAYEDAARVLLQAAERAPESRLVFFMLAKTYESAPGFQLEIRRAFQNYLARSPKDGWAHAEYGKMLASSSLERAKAEFAEALRLDPKLAEPHLQLGLIAEQQGDASTAIRHFQRAIEADPNMPAPRYRLGLAYQKAGEPEKARTELAKFQQLKQAQDQAARSELLRVLTGR